MDSQVWVLSIHHRHGEDTTVHASEPAARDALAGYVVQCWPEVAGTEYSGSDGQLRRVPQELPADPDQAIATYFEASPDEWFDLQQQQVSG
ncbi:MULTISPECIES: hypothetical protein [Mycobacteriaceae]|uniref:hypothetical protein n=1 Tax=Mycobacteriaceae TaxID=1762 RepID=UPI0009FEB662|nr:MULTISPECIES: hypothetical protein [Mycobacteriaceae]MBU8838953.1 hypothetical protein [Mycolicibacterium goodii]UCN12660.1 hypothetical protein LFT50_29660 [Mycobacterium intracellulare subsp. chimaera]